MITQPAMKPIVIHSSVVAIASLVLSSCSQPFGSQSQNSVTNSPTPTLPTSLPLEFKRWPRQSVQITACGFDRVPLNSNGINRFSGWGIIDAKAGVVPEAFIVEFEKNGKTYYQTTAKSERRDIASKLGNPSLLSSGFNLEVKSESITPPYTAAILLAFDKRIFACEYKNQVN